MINTVYVADTQLLRWKSSSTSEQQLNTPVLKIPSFLWLLSGIRYRYCTESIGLVMGGVICEYVE